MKAEGHPTLNNVCFLDVSTGKRFLTKSTIKSARKENIDGQEYFIVLREMTRCHLILKPIQLAIGDPLRMSVAPSNLKLRFMSKAI